MMLNFYQAMVNFWMEKKEMGSSKELEQAKKVKLEVQELAWEQQ